MATSPLETMDWPVVPAGISALATTTEVVAGATAFVPDAALLACTFHTGVGDRAPGDEQDDSDHHQYECLPFHRSIPPSQPANNVQQVVYASVRALGSVGEYDGKGTTYIGPFDHSPMQHPWSDPQMVHMSYVPAVAGGPESKRTCHRDVPIDIVSEVGPAARDTEEGVRLGTAHVENAEAAEAATRRNAVRRWSSSLSSSCS